ncbi:MAG TPA: DUF938 domain-containing protein [Thermohalobaculum sp.]|nr:DUF938 domain-containing protein [Thermohalobaculum sp.]
MTAPPFTVKYTPETAAAAPDGRLFSPSFSRNFEPITDALRPLLEGRGGALLEIGSGTGQHVAHWAAAFPGLTWVPSDIHPEHHASIAAWARVLAPPNLAAPLHLDAGGDWAGTAQVRALGPLAAVIAVNVIHIAPWPVAEGIVAGAARALAQGGDSGGALVFYGPFRRAGQHTAPSNAAFDAALRAENRDWGVRDLDEVAMLAGEAGFGPARVVEMPANNLLAAFPRA